MISLIDCVLGRPEQQGQQAPQKPQDPVRAIHFASSVHMMCIAPFLRAGFGREGIGPAGVCSGVLLFICAAAEPLMTIWLVAWIIAVIVQRVITFRLIRKGAVIHSRFAGESLLRKVPFLRKAPHIMVLEGVLCLFLGMLLLLISEFLAVFMAIGFLSFAIRYSIEDIIRERRHQRMKDARIEAEYYRMN